MARQRGFGKGRGDRRRLFSAFRLKKPVNYGVGPRPRGSRAHNAPISNAASRAALFLQLALERLDFLGEGGVGADEMLDLTYGVQDGGVVAAAEASADFRQQRRVRVLARYIATWRGRTTLAVRREDNRSPRLTL